jgi:uroporphyrinogen III methyltransferase/synthase
VTPELPPGELDRRLTPPPDVILFTSSSTATNFAKLFGNRPLHALLEGTVVASIGPVTSATIRKLGLTVGIEAKESTIPGLLQAVTEYFRR